MNEKEVNQMNEMRLLHLVEPFLLPFLQKRHEELLNVMYQKHNSGEKDFVAIAAQLAQIKEMVLEFERIKSKGAKVLNKVNQDIDT